MPPSFCGRKPYPPADPSAGRRRGSDQDPARRPDPARRTPGGSLATSPLEKAAAATSAQGSRVGRTGA